MQVSVVQVCVRISSLQGKASLHKYCTLSIGCGTNHWSRTRKFPVSFLSVQLVMENTKVRIRSAEVYLHLHCTSNLHLHCLPTPSLARCCSLSTPNGSYPTRTGARAHVYSHSHLHLHLHLRLYLYLYLQVRLSKSNCTGGTRLQSF